MFISVDLPAPFSPSSACTSLLRRSKSTLSFASTPGNRFVIPRSSRSGATAIAAMLSRRAEAACQLLCGRTRLHGDVSGDARVEAPHADRAARRVVDEILAAAVHTRDRVSHD